MVVNHCACTGDKKYTASHVDQWHAEVFAGTDDREVGVPSAVEQVGHSLSSLLSLIWASGICEHGRDRYRCTVCKSEKSWISLLITKSSKRHNCAHFKCHINDKFETHRKMQAAKLRAIVMSLICHIVFMSERFLRDSWIQYAWIYAIKWWSDRMKGWSDDDVVKWWKSDDDVVKWWNNMMMWCSDVMT